VMAAVAWAVAAPVEGDYECQKTHQAFRL